MDEKSPFRDVTGSLPHEINFAAYRDNMIVNEPGTGSHCP